MLKRLLLILPLFFYITFAARAEIPVTSGEPDTITARNSIFRRIYRYFMESNEEKKDKRFDFSIIGGPHFASDTKLGLGIVASGLYRTNRTDTLIPPSNISFYGDITTTGFYLLGIRGNTIFSHDRYRLGINLFLFSFPSKYWGIGYANGSRNDDYTTYKRLEKQARLDFSRRVIANTYLGITGIYQHVNGKNFKDPAFLNGAESDIGSLGFGAFLSYDSRDFIPNPYRGFYAKMEHIVFPGFLGNRYDFQRTELSFRSYNRVWKGAILATDLRGTFNYGNTPWSMVALMGGSYQMRGYYEGQYRDNNLIQAQAEIRQHIYNRHGVAVWGGAGNVFPDLDNFNWRQTLPTYGIGYRWEFKKRVNIRLDYGFGKGQSAFYFNIDEAF